MGTSNTGTNGKKSIEEIIKKDSVIRKLLERGEVVEYISYKKGMGYKIIAGFMVLVGIFAIFALREFILPGEWGIPLILAFYFLWPLNQILEGWIGKLVITDKGVIVRTAFSFFTDKYYYSEIKSVSVQKIYYTSMVTLRLQNRKTEAKVYSLLSSLTIDEAKTIAFKIESKLKGKE
ncbi:MULTISPECIES: hypothetical protein [Psychrilyobacter]|uniref:DUF304 domain-containing protein n=1 Tax=Psychrilyobacter piezotolerans TaxID=2293438 RepID=A0ABX9KEF4_9FUSO|nr:MULTISPECIES: hypothetical protein [Psychrilyobacter]MCS5422237.1 hypothetical protein [Psychrilyobacter sp. S5]NDI78750.1 hypothetical protein [Psychrilyobacter piezotolerans]RDE59600.1 hypothetical protein DV867_12620 [Psychrilyobacter sp. S5]REI40014.1 hypothetical protein DYH56_12620 [Psychrilyobacter piezotolerans]